VVFLAYSLCAAATFFLLSVWVKAAAGHTEYAQKLPMHSLRVRKSFKKMLGWMHYILSVYISDFCAV